MASESETTKIFLTEESKYFVSEGNKPKEYEWNGNGPEPKFWYAEDGTKVFRSYEDYCNG